MDKKRDPRPFVNLMAVFGMRCVMCRMACGVWRVEQPCGIGIFEGVEQVGQEFSKDNRIDFNNPYGRVVRSESLKPICFSLLPMLMFNDAMPAGLLGWKPAASQP